MSEDKALREANMALATRIMNDFGRNMDGWYDNLHDDIVMEFPFGPTVGMAPRVEGKDACTAVFAAVVAGVQVKFHDIVIHPMLDPSTFVVEYKGHGEPGDLIYDQVYIGIQKYQDGKMILFKEYWNALTVFQTFGDISALTA